MARQSETPSPTGWPSRRLVDGADQLVVWRPPTQSVEGPNQVGMKPPAESTPVRDPQQMNDPFAVTKPEGDLGSADQHVRHTVRPAPLILQARTCLSRRWPPAILVVLSFWLVPAYQRQRLHQPVRTLGRAQGTHLQGLRPRQKTRRE